MLDFEGGRGVQLYKGSRLPYILPSSYTRKPGGRGVQLKLPLISRAYYPIFFVDI